MKKFVKILAVVMAVVLSATLLYACGGKDSGDSTTAPAQSDASQTEAPAATNGKLIMATNATFPPYEYYEGDKIVGIDAEIGALIAEKLGMEFEIKDMDFNGILGAVQNGIADIGMAGMTVTEERLEAINFSDSYTTATQVIIVKE